MFNNPVAKDLCVDINAGYLLQTGLRAGKTHLHGRQGFEGFRAGLSALAAGHSILECKYKTEETSWWERIS